METLPDCRPEWRDNFAPESVYKACYICDETLVGLHVLTKHLRMHGEGRFPCPTCGAVSSSGLALHDHMRAHFKNLIVDEEGNSNFKRIRKKRLSHKVPSSIQSQSGTVPTTDLGRQKFACPEPECSPSTRRRPFYYPSAKAFASHMVEVHGKKPFGCDVCGARYHKKVILFW